MRFCRWLEIVSVASLAAVTGPALGADRVAEFTDSAEGWVSVSHPSATPPWSLGNVTASDANPAVANGFLRVQDLNNDWQCVVAPASFLGNWERFAELRIGLVTDDSPTSYGVLVYLAGSVDGVQTNQATLMFPVSGTPASTRFDLSASLDGAQWTMLAGTWTNLLKQVEQCWIRMDLNSNVAGEVDLLDYVKLVDGGDLTLRIHRAVELEFFAVAGVQHQIQVSGDMATWKNYGAPVLGDGSQRSVWVRVGDQDQLYFRLVRVP